MLFIHLCFQLEKISHSLRNGSGVLSTLGTHSIMNSKKTRIFMLLRIGANQPNAMHVLKRRKMEFIQNQNANQAKMTRKCIESTSQSIVKRKRCIWAERALRVRQRERDEGMTMKNYSQKNIAELFALSNEIKLGIGSFAHCKYVDYKGSVARFLCVCKSSLPFHTHIHTQSVFFLCIEKNGALSAYTINQNSRHYEIYIRIPYWLDFQIDCKDELTFTMVSTNRAHSICRNPCRCIFASFILCVCVCMPLPCSFWRRHV